MAKDSFFCNLSSDRIEEIINRSNEYVCYAVPGIRSGPAAALKNAIKRLGKEMVVGRSRRGQTYTFDIFTYFAQLTQLRRSQIWVVRFKLSSQFH